jgi:hypothetical protein
MICDPVVFDSWGTGAFPEEESSPPPASGTMAGQRRRLHLPNRANAKIVTRFESTRKFPGMRS